MTHGPLSPAEFEELQSELPSDEDRGLISKAMVVFACGVAGVVIFVVGAVL